MPPRRVSLPYWEETAGQTQDLLERLRLWAGLQTPLQPTGRAAGGRGSRGVSSQAAARVTWSQIKCRKCTDGPFSFCMAP